MDTKRTLVIEYVDDVWRVWAEIEQRVYGELWTHDESVAVEHAVSLARRWRPTHLRGVA